MGLAVRCSLGANERVGVEVLTSNNQDYSKIKRKNPPRRKAVGHRVKNKNRTELRRLKFNLFGSWY